MQNHALITGAAKRIGRHLALDLARQGFAISVHYHRSGDEAEAVVAKICEEGGQAAAFQADLNDHQAVQALEESACQCHGPVGLLINNASAFEYDDLDTLTQDSWGKHFQPHVQAPVFLARAMARRLPKTQQGLVINMIDQRVWALNPKFFSYTLSKAALWTATQILAQALAPRIRVNAIGPGPTLPSARQSQDNFQKQIEATLLQVQPSLEEFTRAVDFIRHAPSMTGQMIALDSGQHLAWQTPDVVDSIE